MTFQSCGKKSIGLYPVVDSVDWVKWLLPIGVTSIQLRIKNKHGIELEHEISESIKIAKEYDARLFINDYWEIALKHDAYGVHLGQEDINTADINLIRNAGLRLGISTHNEDEIARAYALKPSYLACGPVYPTTSKIMPHQPLGIHQLKEYQQSLNYPIVAIGGIAMHNIKNVLATSVNGIALISAITKAHDPIHATQQLLKAVSQYDLNH